MLNHRFLLAVRRCDSHHIPRPSSSLSTRASDALPGPARLRSVTSHRCLCRQQEAAGRLWWRHDNAAVWLRRRGKHQPAPAWDPHRDCEDMTLRTRDNPNPNTTYKPVFQEPRRRTAASTSTGCWTGSWQTRTAQVSAARSLCLYHATACLSLPPSLPLSPCQPSLPPPPILPIYGSQFSRLCQNDTHLPVAYVHWNNSYLFCPHQPSPDPCPCKRPGRKNTDLLSTYSF